MPPVPPTSGSSAEDVFSAFLERVEAGESADFDELCTRHPDVAAKLRRIHARWRTMTVAFTALSQASSSKASVGDSASLTTLMQRLTSGGGRWQRYAVGSEIARGAMGRVVKAWDEELRRDVALKILRGPQDDGRMQRRFVEEAQIAAQLDHPGVVPIHELGADTAGRPFFAMRLVRGRDLGEVLELERRGAEGWSRTRVLHVLLRVCETMAYAHHKGVVHRDLKPGNIMVGHFGETYVMDWGLARVVGEPGTAPGSASELDTVRAQIEGEDDGSPLLTKFGDVVGTPAYMAPEQAAGGGATTNPQVDVYAIGAILYHLLAGGMPYTTPGQPAGADRILTALRAGPPPRLPDSVPGELRAICERAMARASADRYGGVQALADDLRAFLELRVVSAYATGSLAELRKWIARNRGLAAISAAFVLALVVGVVVAIYLWLEAGAARDRADYNARSLAVELDRSQFRNARLSLRFDDATSAGQALWRHHLAGEMPRATRWALVELAERSPVLATQPHTGEGETVFSRPTGTVLLTTQDGRLGVFDARTLEPRQTLGRDGVRFASVAASQSEPWAVTGDRDGELTFWDLEKGTVLRTAKVHTGVVECIEIAADGRSFASADSKGTVLYWPDRLSEPGIVERQPQRVIALAFDSKSERIASSTDHGGLRCTTIEGHRVLDLRFGQDPLMALSFAPGDRELWVGGRAIGVVDLELRKLDRVLSSRNGTCRELIHDVDGSVIAAGWWRIDRFKDGPRGEPLDLMGAWKLDLDRTARRLVALRGRASLDLIDLSDKDLRRLTGSGAISMSRDGKTAVTFQRGDLLCYDAATGSTTSRFRVPHTGWVALEGNGRRALLIGQGATGVTVVDTQTQATVCKVEGPTETPFNESAAFRPDADEFATVLGDDRIRRHNATTGEKLGEFVIAGEKLVRIRYSMDGSKLAAISRGSRAVRVFDLARGTHTDIAFDHAVPDGLNPSIAAVALDRDGSRVAIGTWGGMIAVHDTATKKLRTFQSHSGTTWSIAFSPSDPELLVSSTGAGGVTFWDLDSGEACYQTWRLEGPVGQMQISDDGRTLSCFPNTGPVLVDLEYRERHVAGILEHSLRANRDRMVIRPEREAELRSWAAGVLSRPWPRWQ